MTPSQIHKVVSLTRGNVQVLLSNHNAFTIGWCAAFQRAHVAEGWS